MKSVGSNTSYSYKIIYHKYVETLSSKIIEVSGAKGVYLCVTNLMETSKNLII